MKALSVRQPWADLIASGRKTVETRTWATLHRGPLLIVAGVKDAPRHHRQALGVGPTPRHRRGIAVCIVDVVDCRPMTDADADAACCGRYPGAFAWVLARPRPVPPVPVSGRLSLFDVDESMKGASDALRPVQSPAQGPV